MKPYFAKYLPVEEEVKEEHVGQYVQSGDNRFLLQSNKLLNSLQPYAKNKIELLNHRGYKVVKLFLCSRDIQVGDKVRGGEWNNDEKEWTKLFEDFMDKSLYYKVIGEISPEAIWVKEGDEFDENQIKKKGKLAINHYVDWIEGREKLGYECMIFIKCSMCKKFH